MKLSSFRFHDADEIEGTAASVDREQVRRDQRLRLAMKSDWPEIPRDRLEFGRYLVTDTGTNELYSLYHGEVEAQFTPVAAYFVNDEGDPVFLEIHAHARTVEALAAKREALEQARQERMKPRARQ